MLCALLRIEIIGMTCVRLSIDIPVSCEHLYSAVTRLNNLFDRGFEICVDEEEKANQRLTTVHYDDC